MLWCAIKLTSLALICLEFLYLYPRDKCIFMFVIFTNKNSLSAFSSCHWLLLQSRKWLSYQVCFGWLPGCCLSYTACRVLLCRSEWSIFPQAHVGTSCRMLLLHTLSLEGSQAPQQPKLKHLQTFNEVPSMHGLVSFSYIPEKPLKLPKKSWVSEIKGLWSNSLFVCTNWINKAGSETSESKLLGTISISKKWELNVLDVSFLLTCSSTDFSKDYKESIGMTQL